jgi:hypothetical protein
MLDQTALAKAANKPMANGIAKTRMVGTPMRRGTDFADGFMGLGRAVGVRNR